MFIEDFEDDDELIGDDLVDSIYLCCLPPISNKLRGKIISGTIGEEIKENSFKDLWMGKLNKDKRECVRIENGCKYRDNTNPHYYPCLICNCYK